MGSPYVLTDDRVRSLDVTPTLGRGYSLMTNAFLSTCMEAMITTTSSYNYDYSFSDFTASSNMETELSGDIKTSFAYDFIKEEVNEQTSSSSTSTSSKNYVISIMSIERFYASIREEVTPLSPAAKTLLTNQDYVGFFMACGSNYVRGVRRKQEVTAIFMFESSSSSQASEFASALTTTGGATGDTAATKTEKSKFNSISSSLEIKIMGFGMGLNQEGSGTLVASNLEEYNGVMKFAFKAMTQSGGGASDVGMVYGVEIVPWVDNVNFQVDAQLSDEVIEVPLVRSLIPRAYNRTNRSDREYTYATRDAFKCAEPAYVIDMYGYCCELSALFDPYENLYNPQNITERMCKPLRQLDGSIVKNNMASNGEFVVRLDKVIRGKLNFFSTLEKCVGEAGAIESRYDRQILKQVSSATFDAEFFASYTVYELKKTVDPLGDYGLLTQLGYELDEFMEMYYQRCVAALFGSGGPNANANFFMANPWTSHAECMLLSCTVSSLRWNRDGTGCVPGVLAGKGMTPYGDGPDAYCALDNEAEGGTETCKFTNQKLNLFHDRARDCWNTTLSGNGAVEYFVNNFCMPTLSSRTMDTATYQALVARSSSCN